MIPKTKEITFERDSLYEEVWSKPMRVLAEHYGLSDNGLRKVCAALAIPLPKQGHWAKAAAGQKVPKAPLPPHDGRTVFISRPPAPAPFDHEHVAEREMALEKAMTRQQQKMVLVFDPATRLHRVLVPYEQKLRESAKEFEKARDAFLNPPKRPRWDNPVVRLANQYEYWLKDGFELCHRSRGLPFRVTPSTWQRALTIVNTIVLCAETLKMNVESVDKPPRIVIKSADIAVYIRIAEHFEAELVKPSDNPIRSKHWKGTGELRLFLSHESWSSPKYIADSSQEPLESKSETILSAIDRQLAAARIADLERKDRERRWQEEKERAETERERQERERQRLKNEQDRRDALEKEATDWDRAEKLRRYAAVLEGKLPTRSNAAAANGLVFAEELRNAADFLDPSAERLESFDHVIEPESF